MSKIFNVISYRTGECYVSVNVEDFIVYSVYISRNCSENMFNKNLSDLFNNLRIARTEGRQKIIITGDINAKNSFWGGQLTDKRGKVLLETTESMGLYILNDGGTPTLERINGSSYIDITIVSEEIIERNPIWTVLEDEISMSDHHFILLEVPTSSKRRGKSKNILGIPNKDILKSMFREKTKDGPADVNRCEKSLIKAYKKSAPRIRCNEN